MPDGHGVHTFDPEKCRSGYSPALHGHANRLHLPCSSRAGQGLPPNAAFLLTNRFRVLTPLSPHDLEQAVCGPQSCVSQSIGQGDVLHSSNSFKTGQGRPQWFGSRCTPLTRTRVPVPHDLVQDVHASQPWTAQLTGVHSHFVWPGLFMYELVSAGQDSQIRAFWELNLPTGHGRHFLSCSASAIWTMRYLPGLQLMQAGFSSLAGRRALKNCGNSDCFPHRMH